MKTGFKECLSCWRVLTAYIRLDPSTDKLYVADRDRKIVESAQKFTQAFAPWMKPEYSEQDQVQLLASVMRIAAELGIFLWSHPCVPVFQWPAFDPDDTLIVFPSLLANTDAYGQKLPQARVIFKARSYSL